MTEKEIFELTLLYVELCNTPLHKRTIVDEQLLDEIERRLGDRLP